MVLSVSIRYIAVIWNAAHGGDETGSLSIMQLGINS